MFNVNLTTENLYTEDLYSIPGAVVVIITREWKDLSEDEKALLNKILGSVKLTLDAVQVLAQTEASIEKLKVYQPANILSFGSPIHPLVKPYENKVIEGVSVLQADSLDKLDDTKKKSLWLGLRQMFGI